VEENVMKKWISATIMVFSFMVQNGKADEIASLSFERDLGEVGTFKLWYSEIYEIPDPIPSTIVNWDNIVTQTNIGNTILSNRLNDPEFDGFAALATNGIDDHFRNYWNGHIWGHYESNYFNNPNNHPLYKSLTLNGIDLEGYHIDSIGLTIESYNLYTYSFYGTLIPEPAALVLLGLGGLRFLRKDRRLRNYHLARLAEKDALRLPAKAER
jgi:hypothetical protein